jgi:hypothetical protein
VVEKLELGQYEISSGLKFSRNLPILLTAAQLPPKVIPDRRNGFAGPESFLQGSQRLAAVWRTPEAEVTLLRALLSVPDEFIRYHQQAYG